MIELTDQEFTTLRDFVLSNYGIDLTKKRVLIQGRLTGVLQQKGFRTFSEYIDMIKNDKSGLEIQTMLNRLTTNLTFFLREKDHFDYLANSVLPDLEKKIKNRPLRVWSAGCSSGEEPYTLAMIMSDYFGVQAAQNKFAILASDISQDVLAKAQLGIYPESGMKDVPQVWLTKYFDRVAEGYQVKDFIKKMISFKTFNLMEPFRFRQPLDIIFCRNVMIYFEQTKKDRLLKQFYDWTTPGGYFFISHSENINRSSLKFTIVRPSVFRRD